MLGFEGRCNGKFKKFCRSANSGKTVTQFPQVPRKVVGKVFTKLTIQNGSTATMIGNIVCGHDQLLVVASPLVDVLKTVTKVQLGCQTSPGCAQSETLTNLFKP